MKHSEETMLLVRGLISQLPAAEQEQCNELIAHLKHVLKQAGEVVGTLALAYVGAEEQSKTE